MGECSLKDIHYLKGLVSICIPTYNRPNLLSQLLDSILVQTYTNIEIIITDNSDDLKTQELIESKYHDKRIRYFKNENNLGMDGNSLKALGYVRGEFFTFTPDDDIWIDDKKLEKQVNLLSVNSEVKCCFSNAYHIQLDGSEHIYQFKTLRGNTCKIIDSKDLLLTCVPEHFVCILTGCIKSEYLDIFKKSWEFGSEEYFMWFIGGTGQKIGFCYENLIAIRDGEHNWEISSEDNKTLINYKHNNNRRANQIIDIYMHLTEHYQRELIYFSKDIEVKVIKILIRLIGFQTLNIKNKFKKINAIYWICFYGLLSFIDRRFQ